MGDVVEAMLVVMREEEMLKTRYPIILIQELFLLGRWDQMDEWLKKAQNNASTHFLLHLLKSTSMKVREEGRDVKSANKLLKDASRLHLITSPKQRPIDFIPDLRSRPIWPMEELTRPSAESA